MHGKDFMELQNSEIAAFKSRLFKLKMEHVSRALSHWCNKDLYYSAHLKQGLQSWKHVPMILVVSDMTLAILEHT